MTTISKFAQSYLATQGVLILPKSRVVGKPVQERDAEVLPKVMQYERGDLV